MSTEMKGRSRGGKAKNDRMTAEERKEHSKKMAIAKKERASIPKATHFGEIKIGETVIDCAILENGTRVLSERAVTRAFGAKRGGSHWLRKRSGADGADLPVYASASNIFPFINNDLMLALRSPIKYRGAGGGIANGLPAKYFPEVCNVWLMARDAKALHPSQFHLATQADILIRGLATVGIIALVDEATGYQRDRARDALAKILEAYVAKEIQPYVKTFDADYYEHMFRLRGLPYPPDSSISKPQYRPQYFGKLTNDIVYKRLAPGVLEALKEESKKEARKTHLHRHLTAGYGRLELIKHLAIVRLLMRRAKGWQDFMDELNKEAPRYGDTRSLDIEPEDS